MANTTLAIVLALATQGTVGFEAELDTALGTAGLNTQTARMDENILRFFGPTEFTHPFYSALQERPWRLPFFADGIRREMAAAFGLPSDQLNTMMRLGGAGSRRTLLGSPIAAAEAEAAKPDGLEKVLQSLKQAGVVKGDIPNLTTVPADVKSAAALILNAMNTALGHRRLALRGIPDVADAYTFVALRGRDDLGGEDMERMLRLHRNVDSGYFGAAAHDIFYATYRYIAADRGPAPTAPRAAAQRLKSVSPQTKYDVEIDTTWGVIRLTGGSDTQHADRPTLLIIDTGGNDTYLNCPSNASAGNWASVVIDTQGNDRYLSDPVLANTDVEKFAQRRTGGAKPGPGGALFGIVCLVDLQGDDRYATHRPGLGSGRFGFAMVQDDLGIDRYDAYADSQGFGYSGYGLLEDHEGNDLYLCFTQSQGSGSVRGSGLLIDRAGNDRYFANETVIDFPSPQSDKHNVSLAQGASIGRRADYIDAHSLAGGVGMLYDAAGDDEYRAGVFGQGVGYWEGVGMLLDGAGKDKYHGQWYVQGAAAHFALGYLEDLGGDDEYTAPMNMAQGAGHDFSIGWLLDREGNDRYKAPNLSLGGGNANGLGVFIDLLGDDVYESSGLTLGKAAEATAFGVRSRALCLGVFLDFAGSDTYPSALTWAQNGARTANWTTKGLTPAESQVGVFWDR
jgi:hypothetical protein